MRKNYIFLLGTLFISCISNAQFCLTKGDHLLELGGNVLAGYNYRFYQSTEKDHHKNNFIIDQARIDLKGRVGTTLQYKLEVDMADLVADIQTPTTSMGVIKDAYIDYKTKFFSLRAGYQKLPYGFNSQVSEEDDPFVQRPSLVNKINSRRDEGVTLSHWFPMMHLNVIGGIYSGLGDQVFAVDNTNGKPEFLGRIEYSYPGRSMDQIIDFHDAPMPMLQFGVNAKYKEGTVTTGEDYSLLTINGKKTSYGADASIMYKGLSLQVEAHQLHVVPFDSTRLYSQGKTYTYFKAGGYLAELNYYCKKWKSVFALRYDELNPTDLTYGDTQRTITYAYNYLIHQNFLCLKLQYQQHLNLDYPSDTRYKDDEVRAILQVIFN